MFTISKALKRLAKYGANTSEGLKRFLNDEKLYYECIELLVKDEKFFTLGEAIRKDEYDKCYEIAVALRGAIGNLEITPLYEIISAIVADLSIYDYSDLKTSYQKFESEYDLFRKALQ